MPKGGIWLGLSSKDLLNLQLKTELYAGLWLEVESFKQYCIEFFLRRTYIEEAHLQVCKGLMMVRFDKHPSIDEESATQHCWPGSGGDQSLTLSGVSQCQRLNRHLQN